MDSSSEGILRFVAKIWEDVGEQIQETFVCQKLSGNT